MGYRSEQLEPWRQREAPGDLLHLRLARSFGLALGVLERSDDQVLQHLGLVGLDEARVDLERASLELAVERHPDQAPTRLAYNLEVGEVLLHLLHAALNLLGLLHHFHEVHGGSLPMSCELAARK